MSHTWITFSAGDRIILIEDSGIAAYDRAKGTLDRLGFDLSGYPSYPTVMLGLRTDNIYRFSLKSNGLNIDNPFSFSSVPRPSFVTTEIEKAVSKAVAAITGTTVK